MAPFLPHPVPYHADSIILPNPCTSRLVAVVFCGFIFKVRRQLAIREIVPGGHT
jgi:hypothetical protein